MSAIVTKYLQILSSSSLEKMVAGPGLQSTSTLPMTRHQRVSMGTPYNLADSLKPFPSAVALSTALAID